MTQSQCLLTAAILWILFLSLTLIFPSQAPVHFIPHPLTLSLSDPCSFSCTLSLCLSVRPSVRPSVFLPGVARVKLTRADRDNSLTHSVVYFSPSALLPTLSLHPSVIPRSSLIHPAVQPRLMVFSFRLLLSICFSSPPPAGDLF